MTDENSSFEVYAAPPRAENESGQTRRVGLELELGNLSLERTLEVMQAALGGDVTTESAAQGALENTSFGTFKVELDSTPLKERNYLRPLELIGIDADSETALKVEESVLNVARTVVPIEIVTPPIPWNRLAELDPLWVALSAAGAEGTSASIFYAFGLHLNPEPPDFEVGTVLSTLRSFLLLEDWIVESAHIDISRRIAPYINPFPEAYRRLILQPEYAPDWAALARDYLEHNPTRNRPLDLLPLMAHLNVEGLAERVENWSLVKGRPTYHYRLPNCQVGEAGWSPAIDWNRWLLVERLAEAPDLQRELAAAYLDTSDLPWRLQRGGWVSEVRGRVEHLVGDASVSVS